MARMDNNIEMIRGQFEETLGKLQQQIGSMQGSRGMGLTLGGRRMEMRGRARQQMSRVRTGFENLTDTLRGRGTNVSNFAPWVALGLGLTALALFSPQTFNRTWNWLRNNIWPQAQQRMQQQMQQSPLAEEARRNLFGSQTNR